MFYFALQSSRVPKSCKIKFFFYTNNTGSITQVNEEFYSYFGYLWISHLINQRDLRENIWDNCLRFAQQLLSWMKMNVLNKALLQLSFSLYFVPCAFGCCFQQPWKQIARWSVITRLQLSAQFTDKLCDVPSQTDAFLPTITWRKIWSTSSFAW